MEQEKQKYYLKEFALYDGECFITFNIVSINFEKHSIEVAITDRGKISVVEYDLAQDKNGDFFFDYGTPLNKIKIDDFEEIED